MARSSRTRCTSSASYEREREPNTVVISPPRAGAAADHDADPRRRRTTTSAATTPSSAARTTSRSRGNLYKRFLPNDGVTAAPEPRHQEGHHARTRARRSGRTSAPGTCCRNSAAATTGSIRTYEGADGLILSPEYQFPGLILGLNWNYPEFIRETRYPFRYDLTWKVVEPRPEDRRRVHLRGRRRRLAGAGNAASISSASCRRTPAPASRCDQDPTAWDFTRPRPDRACASTRPTPTSGTTTCRAPATPSGSATPGRSSAG